MGHFVTIFFKILEVNKIQKIGHNHQFTTIVLSDSFKLAWLAIWLFFHLSNPENMKHFQF